MIFWLHVPPVASHYSLAAVSAADGWMRDEQMVPVRGQWRLYRRWAGYLAVCTFDTHTELINSQLMTRIPLQECPPSQPRDHLYERDGGVAAAASHRPHQVNDQQMPRPLPQTLQAEISRKTVKKTVPLKLSEYLDSNAFFNYEEQPICFNFNCCTRTCNSASNPRPTVENIWYWRWGYFVPMHKYLKFLDAQTDH